MPSCMKQSPQELIMESVDYISIGISNYFVSIMIDVCDARKGKSLVTSFLFKVSISL